MVLRLWQSLHSPPNKKRRPLKRGPASEDFVVLRLWQSLHCPLVVVAFARCGHTLFECGVLRAFDGEGPSQHGRAGWVCPRQACLGLGVRRRLSWSKSPDNDLAQSSWGWLEGEWRFPTRTWVVPERGPPEKAAEAFSKPGHPRLCLG